MCECTTSSSMRLKALLLLCTSVSLYFYSRNNQEVRSLLTWQTWGSLSQVVTAASRRRSWGDWHYWGEVRGFKMGWRSRGSEVRWRLWLRGWLDRGTEGFPGCSLQLADHTLRRWRRKQEDKDLTHLCFPFKDLFSLPVCLRLSLKRLRLTCWPICSFPLSRTGFYYILSVVPPPPPFSLLHSSSSLFTVIPLHRRCNLVFACLAR